MKNIPLILLLLSFLSLTNCQKEKIENAKVDGFIKQLESDQYTSLSLPDFEVDDIEALFQHIGNEKRVTQFPSSSYSSYLNPDPNYKVGVLALWAIEYVRAKTISFNIAFSGFPSQHPFVISRKEDQPWYTDHDHEIYLEVIEAYKAWWEENRSKDFVKAALIDPLESTNFRWR